MFFIILIYSIVSVSYTYVVAKAKGYDSARWMLGGLLFGVIALLAIVGTPPSGKPIKDTQVDYQKEINNKIPGVKW